MLIMYEELNQINLVSWMKTRFNITGNQSFFLLFSFLFFSTTSILTEFDIAMSVKKNIKFHTWDKQKQL